MIRYSSSKDLTSTFLSNWPTISNVSISYFLSVTWHFLISSILKSLSSSFGNSAISCATSAVSTFTNIEYEFSSSENLTVKQEETEI